MTNQDKFEVIPKCMQMCPTTECLKREKENLIHILESDESKETKYPKANRSKMIKCYSRSAAGHQLLKDELLRPPSVLLKTVNYIFKNVFNDSRVSKLKLYDFINDRIRSVKQDAVIQRLNSKYWIKLLPPMIRFYVYSAYMFCMDSKHFDSVLNKNQLFDCLIHIICAYEIYEEYNEVRAEMETYYLIINFHNFEVINRAIQLNLQNDLFQRTLKIVLKYHQNNYCSVLRSLMKLQLLPACLIIALHLNRIRKNALQCMAFAYCNKNVGYPVDKLKKNLLFNSDDETKEECMFYKIPVNLNNSTIQFQKILFENKVATEKKLNSIDEVLFSVSACNLILYNQFDVNS